ncbi:MAG: hypothetical protein C5B45_00180 [Chlamydiae bacterium]|nr:MAG: hypothetical protein C5B45_00180 [Chlamydiota bacterium]
MSAITKSIFAPSSMDDVVSLEAKGKKSGGGDKGSKGSKGSRPETKKNFEPKNKNTPGTVLPIQYGPIPPRDKHVPNVMYIDPSNSVAEINAGKSFSKAEESAAIKTVLSWKSRGIYDAYAEKARGSSSSGTSGPVTYDGGKVMARGASSDVGSKSTAVYSTGGSNNSCTIL